MKGTNNNLTPRNAKGQAHGKWTYYYDDNCYIIGKYENSKQTGLWVRYAKHKIVRKAYHIR